MCNASEFMKTLKQHYTMSFNGRRDHSGTMWESRFRVRVCEPEEIGVLLKWSGYVDGSRGSGPLVKVNGKSSWKVRLGHVPQTVKRVSQDSALARNRFILQNCTSAIFASIDTAGALDRLFAEFPNLPYGVLADVR